MSKLSDREIEVLNDFIRYLHVRGIRYLNMNLEQAESHLIDFVKGRNDREKIKVSLNAEGDMVIDIE